MYTEGEILDMTVERLAAMWQDTVGEEVARFKALSGAVRAGEETLRRNYDRVAALFHEDAMALAQEQGQLCSSISMIRGGQRDLCDLLDAMERELDAAAGRVELGGIRETVSGYAPVLSATESIGALEERLRGIVAAYGAAQSRRLGTAAGAGEASAAELVMRIIEDNRATLQWAERRAAALRADAAALAGAAKGSGL